MNDFDDLDELERELGPALRVALRRAAERITDEPRQDVHRLDHNVAEAPASIDDAAGELALEPVGREAIAVDLGPRRDARTGRRRGLIAVAAVVAALLVAAATVLVNGSGGNDVRTVRPAGRTPMSTPLPPTGQQFLTPSGDAVFPLEGAMPSTPETGELVAGVAFTRFITFPDADGWRDTSIVLYADGRLLRYPIPDVHGGVSEQRLTPEGVELVRSAFAPTGLLDPAQTPTDTWWSCLCVIRVRDDSGRLVDIVDNDIGLPPPQRKQVDPQVQGEVDRLIEFITHLDASLPASAWADREIKAYVPSRYEVTVWFEPWEAPEPLRNDSYNVAVPDLSNVLTQVLPSAVVQHLDDQGWQHTSWEDSVVLTTADARALAQAFTDAGHTPIWPGFNTWGMGLTYRPTVRTPDPTSFRFRVQALLPDGPPLWAPG